MDDEDAFRKDEREKVLNQLIDHFSEDKHYWEKELEKAEKLDDTEWRKASLARYDVYVGVVQRLEEFKENGRLIG